MSVNYVDFRWFPNSEHQINHASYVSESISSKNGVSLREQVLDDGQEAIKTFKFNYGFSVEEFEKVLDFFKSKNFRILPFTIGLPKDYLYDHIKEIQVEGSYSKGDQIITLKNPTFNINDNEALLEGPYANKITGTVRYITSQTVNGLTQAGASSFACNALSVTPTTDMVIKFENQGTEYSVESGSTTTNINISPNLIRGVADGESFQLRYKYNKNIYLTNGLKYNYSDGDIIKFNSKNAYSKYYTVYLLTDLNESYRNRLYEDIALEFRENI